MIEDISTRQHVLAGKKSTPEKAIEPQLVSSMLVDAINSKWNQGITADGERLLSEQDSSKDVTPGAVDAMTAK